MFSEFRSTPKTSEDRLSQSFNEVSRNIISESDLRPGGSDSSPRAPLEIKYSSKDAALVPKDEQSDLSSVLDRIGKNAELIVGSAASGQVGVYGIGRWFPSGRVDVRKSCAVLVGNNCKLKSEEHYHVQRTTVSMERLDEIKDEVAALVAGKLSPQQFQAALRPLCAPPSTGTTQARRRVAAGADTSVSSCADVVVGDGNSVRSRTRCVVHETVLPLVELMAADDTLAESFAGALREDKPGSATSGFLRDLLRAGRRMDVSDLLGCSTGLNDAPDALLMSFFGSARVKHADSVLLGTNNELRSTTNIRLPKVGRGDFVDDLACLRHDIVPPPSGPATDFIYDELTPTGSLESFYESIPDPTENSLGPRWREGHRSPPEPGRGL
jgi:hypothetical protein